jgi:hypothetical protein
MITQEVPPVHKQDPFIFTAAVSFSKEKRQKRKAEGLTFMLK